MKQTKSIIIQTAFEAIHKNGYYQLRIDKELMKLGITKGAFYHYFNGKEALLAQVIDEILGPKFIKPWNGLNPASNNVLDQIQTVLQEHIDQSSMSEIKHGCVFNNLVHELSAEMPAIRDQLRGYFNQVNNSMEQAFVYGIEQKQIKPILSAKQLTVLIMSIYNGSNSINKLYLSPEPYKQAIKSIIILLESIRYE